MASVSASRPTGKTAAPAQESQPRPEPVGILSRTLNSSSTIRWILPARIRSPSKNDVVFVGATYVQLHEFLDTGLLASTTAKLDFGTQITDAKVISAELKIVPVVDAILKQERDQEQYSIRGQPLNATQPPQILILLTVDNELIYVYARQDLAGDVKLVFAKRPLLRGAGLPANQCRYVAVDPESRALAVASTSGYFGVFKLRSVDEIKSQIDSWNPPEHGSFRPCEEQRFIQIDGDIVKIEFLRSPDTDPAKVLLLLLVHSGEETQDTHQYLYKWDTRTPLQTIRPMTCSGRQLKEDRLPVMLIPSTRPYSFLIVMETGISYYENIHTSDSKRVNCRFIGKMAGPLQWVQWAKPRRHNDYLERRDDLVIVREDGLLQYFQIEKASSTKFSMNNTIGQLGLSVDTAFCMLAGPPGKGGDIIIAGGSMTDGGVFHVSARGSPERIQTIETISPLKDMILGPPTRLPPDGTSRPREVAGRLYACRSKDPGSGDLLEIRYGLEAQIGWTMNYPNAALVDHIWTLEIPSGNELLVICSHTTDTSMVVFDLETLESTFADSESHPGFDFDNPTLAVTMIDHDTAAQVTTGGINIVPVSEDATVGGPVRFQSQIIRSAFFDDGKIIATATSGQGNEIALQSVVFSEDGRVSLRPSSPAIMPDTPTALCCLRVQNLRLLVVGTHSATILGYFVLPNLELSLAFEAEVEGLAVELENSPISSLVALDQNAHEPTLLLCGLRHGALLCLEIKKRPGEGIPKLSICDDFYVLGSTAVNLFQEKGPSEESATSSALVLCHSEMRRVTSYPNVAAVDYAVSSIWLTNRTDPSAEPLAFALHRVPRLESPYDDPGGLLICATDGDLLFCSLASQEQGVVRKLPITGTPKYLIYSDFLQKLVVAFERVHYLTGVPVANPLPGVPPILPGQPSPEKSVLPPRKMQQVGLQLIEPWSKDATNNPMSTIVTEDNNESVVALIDWSPTDGEFHYEWFVLALQQIAPGFPPCSGRVVCVNAKSLRKGLVITNPKTAFRCPDKPVTAICAYKMSSLLIAAGDEIYLLHLDFTTRKWKTLSTHALPSPANSISCQGSFIFIATSQHSVFVLAERDDKLFEHTSDTLPRVAKDVVAFNGVSAMFSVWSGGTADLIALSGFSRDQKSVFTLFQAHLPLLIDHLRLEQGPDSQRGARRHFYGSFVDGTLFYFSLLKQQEWRLLHFLEEMSYPDKKSIKPVQIEKRDADNNVILVDPGRVRPKDWHVRGDRLLMMIEQGPYHLHKLLQRSERFDQFTALVNEAVGETKQPIEAAVAWMRKLLAYPSRL
ncbi:uncharacterized protein Z518_04284 [Rhinocladiella mackenziei CBS 650.93]|uniref:RSE1/DDB1/CPSF1 first beta-propeller domain-containing protein n=1 Tax=Rhinocladiella mackenziei CBS 650.93 TaxID=1442369 RepID=A0A0D2IKS4_9EURO|nr:uncharacterized protein Z518_04284 [Rhinocladiella mackenziei CBS 650.93]KIX06309.1 hypothetical protein Z518_04284 [Rhinocladiella mackenziei CBS 650.93]